MERRFEEGVINLLRVQRHSKSAVVHWRAGDGGDRRHLRHGAEVQLRGALELLGKMALRVAVGDLRSCDDLARPFLHPTRHLGECHVVLAWRKLLEGRGGQAGTSTCCGLSALLPPRICYRRTSRIHVLARGSVSRLRASIPGTLGESTSSVYQYPTWAVVRVYLHVSGLYVAVVTNTTQRLSTRPPPIYLERILRINYAHLVSNNEQWWSLARRRQHRCQHRARIRPSRFPESKARFLRMSRPRCRALWQMEPHKNTWRPLIIVIR